PGVATAVELASPASSFIMPVRARLGPSSQKVSQPELLSQRTESAQRTGELSCRSRPAGIAEASSYGPAVRFATTGTDGTPHSRRSRVLRRAAPAGSISGV